MGGAAGVRDGAIAVSILLLAVQPVDKYTLDAKWGS
jgi:hypothetical protein